ncbi:type VI secretion system tip protein VgrG [bacterium]|nr:type VI secretion system tip protein VgrG [bacterium]
MPITGFEQTRRLLKLTTPLGPDVLLLVGLESEDAISQLYEYRFTTIANRDQDIPFDQLIGRPVCAELVAKSGSKRYFHGHVREVVEHSSRTVFRPYDLVVVPEVWFLTRRAQCRIFQQKSVREILREVFQHIASVEIRLKKDYEKRNFCVQYRETDWDFASRLMEEEGICYYFKHTRNRHSCVIVDTPEDHEPVPFSPLITYAPDADEKSEENVLLNWRKSQNLQPSRFSLRDHNFEMPKDRLEAELPITESVEFGAVTHHLKLGAESAFEIYDYPGGYGRMFDGIDPGGGERPEELSKLHRQNRKTVQLLSERAAAAAVRAEGSGKLRQMSSGHTFEIKSRSDKDKKYEGRYLIVLSRHSARSQANYLAGADGEIEYANEFSCIPAKIPFRPPAVTPRPTIQGTQTATVVGPPGEEIFTDKFGRVKVQFHWDRQGRNDHRSSCWIRVAQAAAGTGFGAIHIPRVDQEVVVSFLEGDPDRPLITGSVYNPNKMPPFELPKKKMLSGLKSNTYPGGGGDNEISVDDSKGSERMYIHSQYNQDTVVGNDQTNHVKNNRKKTIDVDETSKIGNNQLIDVGVNKTVTVGSNHSETVGSNQSVKVGSSQSINVGSTQSETIGMMQNLMVGLMQSASVGIVSAENLGVAKTLTSGVLYAVTVGVAMNTAVGVSSTEQVGVNKSVTVGSTLKISAGSMIEITCGASKLTMDAGGKVTITGTAFNFSASGPVKINGAIIDLN